MRNIPEIADSVRRGERISTDDALTLWYEAPLWLLGELATERKRRASGDKVFYNRNVHLEPSNICLFNCEFCSFRRREGDPDAWYMSLDEVEARARELQGSDITEVHIVGGVHPKHTLDTYCEMIRRVKRALPHVAIKAYTAVEIFYMIRLAGVTVVEGLRKLVDAGMEAIPGGGAEIFDAELRAKICPEKCSAEEWLAVHRAAHNMGLSTNCTMLYGHIETLEQRVDHLNRLRKLQDEAPGFDAFIPLKYRSRNNRMSEIGECSVEEDMRMMAMSRIFLDNIPHIKAYWVAYGRPTTEMALAFGADDIDGTIEDTTKIYSMAGADSAPRMSVAELEALVRDAGFVPIERDTHYNEVKREQQVVEEPVKEPEHNITSEPVAEKKVEPKPQPKPEPKPEPEPKPKPKVVKPSLEQQIKEEMKQKTNSGARRMDSSQDTSRKSNSERKTKEDRRGGLLGFAARHPFITNVALMGVLALGLIIALYIGLLSGTRHGRVIAVPDFRGMNIVDARHVADVADLNIIVRDSIFDVDLPGGTVVDQLPRTSDVRDVTVKPGRKVYLTINAYSRRMVDVPYVAKQTLRQALNQLEREGLTVQKIVYEPDLTSTDYVLRQLVDGKEIHPESKIKVAVGTGVTLHVSYRSEEQNTTVPRLVGLSFAQAKSAVWDNGLNIGKVIYDESVEDIVMRRKARVYKQSLRQSSSVNRGCELSLYLTCDEELLEKSRIEAEAEAKLIEEERRKAELEAMADAME
ncbi:MAG: aminofutalosine synthase MqnE [Alistipes sp.]|nr:aminofutalosine synthase MqnE [Alistipes sp.]